MFSLEDLNVPVLSYPFPEVRQLLGTLSLDESFHMSTIPTTRAANILYQSGYDFSPSLDIPTTPRGNINFEGLHDPITTRITKRNESLIPGLSGFEHRFPTHGSSEAIKTLIAYWSATGEMTELGIVEGEYPGYKFNADCFNPIKDVTPVPSLEEAGDPVEGRVWFISNPSAIDGNWQDTEVLQRFIEAGHEVVLDYAYAGLTIDVPDAEPIDLSAPNIKAILTSPSKIFGVFNHRYTGVAYTREWIGPLYDTQTWFRGVPAMLDTPMLYETFRPHELPRKYQERQLKICQALADLIGQEVRPSDAILTATIDGPFPAEPGTFHGKAQTPQIRLSRLFEKLEKL